jgi:hypothetical protein
MRCASRLCTLCCTLAPRRSSPNASGRRASQTETLVDLLEQQHAAVADDVATIKCGLDDAPSNPSKLDGPSVHFGIGSPRLP